MFDLSEHEKQRRYSDWFKGTVLENRDAWVMGFPNFPIVTMGGPMPRFFIPCDYGDDLMTKAQDSQTMIEMTIDLIREAVMKHEKLVPLWMVKHAEALEAFLKVTPLNDGPEAA